MKMSRSAQNLEAALAACLDDLQVGMTPAQCLARYPEYADQLEPLLLTAERLQGQPWPILSAGGRVRGRERMHAALTSRRPAGFAWWTVLRPLSVAVMLLALAGGVWLAWPGRQQVNTNQQTPVPVVLQPTPSPALTLVSTTTPTLTLMPTPTLTPTPTETSDAIKPVFIKTDVPETPERLGGTKAPAATATLRTRNTATSESRVKIPTSTESPDATVTAGSGGPHQTPQGDERPDAPEQATATLTPSGATAVPSRTRDPEKSSTPFPTATAPLQSRATVTRVPTETLPATPTRVATSALEPSAIPEPTKTPVHD